MKKNLQFYMIVLILGLVIMAPLAFSNHAEVAPNVACDLPMVEIEVLVYKQVEVVGLHQGNLDETLSVVFWSEEGLYCVNAETVGRGMAIYGLSKTNAYVNKSGLTDIDREIKLGDKGVITKLYADDYILVGNLPIDIFGTGELDMAIKEEWGWWRPLVIERLSEVTTLPKGLEHKEVSVDFLPAKACEVMGKYAAFQQTSSEFFFCQPTVVWPEDMNFGLWKSEANGFDITAVFPDPNISKIVALEPGKKDDILELVSCQNIKAYTLSNNYFFPTFPYRDNIYFGTHLGFDVNPVAVVLNLNGEEVIAVVPQKIILMVNPQTYGMRDYLFYSLPESCSS